MLLEELTDSRLPALNQLPDLVTVLRNLDWHEEEIRKLEKQINEEQVHKIERKIEGVNLNDSEGEKGSLEEP